jgi:hypothetical protein
MFDQKVRLDGPIFRSGTSKKAIKAAKRDALDFGVGEIKTWTPVRTGRLKRGWAYKNTDTIYNETPYTRYVEEGTYKMEGYFMVRDTLPRIADYYGDRIRKYLRSEGMID